MKKLFFLTTFAALAVAPAPLYAQKIWLGGDGAGGDGAWGTASHWSSSGAPTSTTGTANATYFVITDNATATSSQTTLTGTNYSNSVRTGRGRTAYLTLGGAGTVLNVASLTSGIDYGANAGLGGGHLFFDGTGTINVTQLIVGFAQSSYIGDSSLTLSGPGLVVKTTGTITPSIVGYGGNNNRFHITNGADVTLFGLVTSSTLGSSWVNNGTIVDGGAKLATTSGVVTVGAYASARSNYLEVKGGASMEARGAFALTIGTAASFGGNYVKVEDGGTLKQSGMTTINVFNANGGNNGGRNRLTIGNGGTFTAGAAITNEGLVQLASGGHLVGKDLSGNLVNVTMTVSKDGRFEAEGDGLAANVTTNVNKSGVFAVGVTEVGGPARSMEAVLTLQSTVNLASESVLEMTYFGNGQGDQILFDGGNLSLTGNVTLRLTLGNGIVPEAGESWVLFTGESVAITGGGSFNLGAIDLNLWDVSLMNEAGGWRIVAVPEPSSYVLMLTSMAAMGVALRRRW